MVKSIDLNFDERSVVWGQFLPTNKRDPCSQPQRELKTGLSLPVHYVQASL